MADAPTPAPAAPAVAVPADGDAGDLLDLDPCPDCPVCRALAEIEAGHLPGAAHGWRRIEKAPAVARSAVKACLGCGGPRLGSGHYCGRACPLDAPATDRAARVAGHRARIEAELAVLAEAAIDPSRDDQGARAAELLEGRAPVPA